MPEKYKDLPAIIWSATLLVLIMVYTWKEKISILKLVVAWVWSILASYLLIGLVQYFVPNLYEWPLHDVLVSVFTLSAFQVLVIAYKKNLLKKIYNKKEKEYLKK